MFCLGSTQMKPALFLQKKTLTWTHARSASRGWVCTFPPEKNKTKHYVDTHFYQVLFLFHLLFCTSFFFYEEEFCMECRNKDGLWCSSLLTVPCNSCSWFQVVMPNFSFFFFLFLILELCRVILRDTPVLRFRELYITFTYTVNIKCL